MKPNTILAILFLLTIRTAAQDASKPQTQSHCEFADGKTITVTYSGESGYRLSTDEDLVTVKGISVPAGNYRLVIKLDVRYLNRTLIMRQQTAAGPPRDLQIPLSISTHTSAAGNPRITFDHDGGSCTLHLASGTNTTVSSLEFRERNTDLPVMP
ncbi:MAG: hypothetical protein ACJ71Q_14725 [Terriglobales bacterium]|jgi:hypothetical protein